MKKPNPRPTSHRAVKSLQRVGESKHLLTPHRAVKSLQRVGSPKHPLASRRVVKVVDVLRGYGPSYLAQHRVPTSKARVLEHLTQCRTKVLGGQVWGCGGCGNRRYRYHSCRHSHCPTCNTKSRADWLDRMLKQQLPVGYSHVVFTVPHELLPLFEHEERLLYNLLFEAAWLVMQRYAKKHHGLKIGVTMILHTWGQRINGHPHIHCLLILGGLTLDNARWIGFADPHALIGSADLADRFRKLFLKRLRVKIKYDKLRLPDGFEGEQLAADGPLARKRWIVNVQSPPDGAVGAGGALKYLAGYVRGSAIGNSRMVDDDGEQVTFSIKDYRSGGQRKNVTIPGSEFIRRFLIHILPFRFWRVRHRGFLAATVKKKALAIIREQSDYRLDTKPPDEKQPNDSSAENFHGDTDSGDEPQLKPPRCSVCGAEAMVWLSEIEPQVGWIRRRYSHFARRARGAGFGPPAPRPP